MNRRFGGARRVPLSRRGQAVILGGGLVVLSALLMLAVVVARQSEIEAETSVTTPEQPLEQLAFGTVVLLAPVESVPRGSRLSQVKFREVYWPRNEVPEGAIRRTEDIQDKFAKVDLPASQPIVRTHLSAVPLLGGLSDLIPPGHRATTIQVDATAGIEGWALPGTHVDVFVTYHDAADGNKKTSIAVENAVVLSFNGDTSRSDGDASARLGGSSNNGEATVTLAVPVDDAMRIHTAVAMGRISLVLRNPGDIVSAGNREMSEDDFRSRRKDLAKGNQATDGFARFTDSSGQQVNVELRGKKWWKLQGEDDL